jgi:hypothetical protein
VTARPRGQCPACRFWWRLRADGTLGAHHLWNGSERQPQCAGTGELPRRRDPGRILVAGDWHGNTAWALRVIRQAPSLLAGEEQRIILVLGDLGIWPGPAGRAYLARLDAALAAARAELSFADGNHEDFTQLAELRPGPDGRAQVTDRIWHLPRGHRWTWHGRAWLALGGGVSLDKAVRTEGRDWWPQEEITAAQEAAAIAGGHADVLVSHDCPAGVVHTFPPPPPFWDLRDLARSDAHRERLQRAGDAVRPSYWIHGHLHIGYQRVCDLGWGPVQVTGLDRDEAEQNYAVLDVRTMQWEPDPPGGG